MSGSKASSTISGGSLAPVSLAVPAPPWGTSQQNASESGEPAPLLLERYQHLTRKHLTHLLKNLVGEYTGLTFRVAWTPRATAGWDSRNLPTGCSVCCGMARTRSPHQLACQICGRKQLARTFGNATQGLFFKCRLGVLNYWLPIRVRSITVGIAYLQALAGEGLRSGVRPRVTRSGSKVSNRNEFRRAARLLHLVVDHLQTLDLADLRKTELRNAWHAIVALEREQDHLRQALKRHLPYPVLVSHPTEANSHSEVAVRTLLDWIARNYAKPITLQSCAAELGMNAAYLCDLFSRMVGVPFKVYLTDLRISKAKALLGDFNRTVSEVSFAVGYSGENRFRVMFKKATGLGPKAWRQTFGERCGA